MKLNEGGPDRLFLIIYCLVTLVNGEPLTIKIVWFMW